MDKWTDHALTQVRQYEELAVKDITTGLRGNEQGLLLALGTALSPLPVQSYYSDNVQAPAEQWKKGKEFTLSGYYEFLSTLQPETQRQYAFSPAGMSLEQFDRFITQEGGSDG